MKLSAGDYVVAIGFVVFLYGTAVPAAVLYQNHPQYKWVLIATVVFDGIVAIAMFVWEVKWWIKHRAAARAAQLSARTNQPVQ
jgi:TctA family transporter